METISTENAPGAIGPYSQAKGRRNAVLFGPVPINIETGEFVSDE